MARNEFHNQGTVVSANIIQGNVTAITKIINNPAEPDFIPNDINFRVAKPELSFTGRLTELDLLQKISLSTRAETIVLTGMGGMGKTQLARKFIAKNRARYENVVWIDSESERSVSESFRKLSKDKLRLSTTDANGKGKDSKSVIEEVLKKLCPKKTLFIYDNVDKLTEIMKFILEATSPSGEVAHVLITSRLGRWPAHITVIRLTAWSPDQAVEYISKMFKELHYDTEIDKRSLARRLQYFPLALRQATAYINKMRESDGTYRISQYVDKFTHTTGEMMNEKDVTDISYDKTTYTTWDITIDAIRRDNVNGQLAIRILNIIAYFAADNIERSIFFRLTSEEKRKPSFFDFFSPPPPMSPAIGEDRVKSAVDILAQYCLIESVRAQEVFSIHRLVQGVTRFKLKEYNEEENALGDAVKLIGKFIDELNFFDSFTFRSHAVLVLAYASKLPNVDKLVTDWHMFALMDAKRFPDPDKAIEHALEIVDLLSDILDENERFFLNIRYFLGEMYVHKGLNEEALRLFRYVFNRQKTNFGEKDCNAVRTLHMITYLIEELGVVDNKQ